MTSVDRDFESAERQNGLPIVDVSNYRGISETIRGFQRIARAIGDTQGIRFIDPVILLEEGYEEYKASGIAKVEAVADAVWNRLDGDNNALIVRRLFPDQFGVRQPGPRSGNITGKEDLVSEILKFYQFFDSTYLGYGVVPVGYGVIPEIMVHRLVDAGNPPKQEQPYLPFAGGDVIPLGDNKFQVRATFGADESIQKYPADSWIVEILPDGSCKIEVNSRGKKINSLVPAPDDYSEITIPEEFQNEPALSPSRVVALAEVCQRMGELYGPYRLEFDGTRIGRDEPLVIIETEPFLVPEVSKDVLARFAGGLVKPVHVLPSESLDFVQGKEPVLVYISNEFLGRDEVSQSQLRRLAGVATARETRLVILAATDISTQHVVLNLLNAGHSVIFVGRDGLFEEGEEVFLHTQGKELSWNRNNPIITPEDSIKRGVEEIGGKALGLAKLTREGFKTSPYFVVETSLYRRLMDELGVGDLVKELDEVDIDNPEIPAITREIRKRIFEYDGDLLTQFSANLDTALADIGGDKVFVRSSANCEDTAHNSFAGAFKTIPDVEANLDLAILEVFASVFNEGTIVYAKGVGVKPSQIAMAVVVQKAVESEKAGTIFTRNHGDDDGSLIINAAYGQGEGIVSGSAGVSQSLIVDKTTREVRPESFGSRILSDEESSLLVGLGLAVEDQFGEGPQDIEWAIIDGEAILLQARPLR